jgi:glycosyltransferase involved in cell wall biosynthesis
VSDVLFSLSYPSRPLRVLSVIIPVRNHARPLARLLARLQSQKPPRGWDVEIIAVDNGSTDDTPAVIRKSGARYLACSELGSAAARNAGAAAARGELLCFIDADACPVDDEYLVGVVETAAQLGTFGAFGGAILLPERQRFNPVAIGDHLACWFNWSPSRPAQRTRLFQPGLSLVVPRAVFTAMKGFDNRLMVLQDMEFQQRLMQAGLPIYFSPRLRIAHEARGSLLRSWRHSWSWGGPFRERYLATAPDYGLRYPPADRRFWRNAPMLFGRRMKLVSRAAWANSRWQAIYGYPFLAATVLAWTLAVIWGREPRPEERSPI